MKVFFDWEVEGLRNASTTTNSNRVLANQEHGFLFALYLISVVSLQSDECESLLGQSKPKLLSDYEMLCEQALATSNFMGTSDIIVLQALALYVVSISLAISYESLIIETTRLLELTGKGSLVCGP